MNLQALYDLKERLEHAAIAGTALLHEDFRLRRAVEALAPLAAANPVFAKISAGAKALLNAPAEQRSLRLPDVLSLVDAVVYTQGVTNIPGDMVPLVPGTGSYVQASYGELQPLIAALGGNGSGRTALIQEYWKEHRDYFSDFRVLPYVVKALGDSYSELAELISAILQCQGTSVLPLLKEGFDPSGKAEMARRVRLIAKIAGAGENEWFLSVLPESQKDVRIAVIQALSLSQENVQVLIDLCRSEKGKLREAALRSLAFMDSPAAVEFWHKEAEKKPRLTDCLAGVDTTLAADLTARSFRRLLEEQLAAESVYNGDALTRFQAVSHAASGKYSEEMASFWRWVAGEMPVFAGIKPEKNTFTDYSLAEHMQREIMESLVCNSNEGMLDLARELARLCPDWFFCCGVLADMASLSAADVYEKYEPCIVRTGLLRRESETERNRRVQLFRAFAPVSWSEAMNGYVLIIRRGDALTGETVTSMRKLDDFDSRWFSLLCDPRVQKDGDILVFNNASGRTNLDALLLNLVKPGSGETVGRYFCDQACATGSIGTYFPALLRCGWKNWDGLMIRCARKSGEIRYDRMLQYYDRVPMPNIKKAEELRQLDDLVKSGVLKVKMNLWLSENIQIIAARLEADPNIEILKKL